MNNHIGMQRFSEKKVRLALADCMSVVGKNVKYYREQKNLTQNELSYIIGSHQDLICRIETRKDHNPEMVTLARIAWALDVNLMCLFFPPPTMRLTGS